MMAALWAEESEPPPLLFAAARLRSMSARVSPAPNAPICKKPRRMMPSQNFCFVPQSVSMEYPPLGRKKLAGASGEKFMVSRHFARSNANFYFLPIVGDTDVYANSKFIQF